MAHLSQLLANGIDMHVSQQHENALGISRSSQSLIDKKALSDLVLGDAGFNPSLHRFVIRMSGSVLQRLRNSRRIPLGFGHAAVSPRNTRATGNRQCRGNRSLADLGL